MSELPAPPVPADVDLKDFAFTPMYRARLFGSSFHARATDAEWRAGVTLWLKSQDQVPAGSLPDDDIDLCRLAELGRDVKQWSKIRAGAMRGWYKCADGRLYHDVVAEVVNEQWQSKLDQRSRTLKARVAAAEKRLAAASDSQVKADLTSQIERLRHELSQNNSPPVTLSVTETVTETKGQGQYKGQGQGQGLKKEGGADAPARPSPPAAQPKPVEPDLDLTPPVALDRNLDEAVRRWNAMAESCGLARVALLSEPRRVGLRRRLAECGGLSGWDAALERVAGSEFLKGDNDRGWKIDFDTLIKPAKFIKLMEGGYDRREGQARKTSGHDAFTAAADDVLAAIRERGAA